MRLGGERPIKKKKVSDFAGDRNRCRMCVKLGGERPIKKKKVSRSPPVTVKGAVSV